MGAFHLRWLQANHDLAQLLQPVHLQDIPIFDPSERRINEVVPFENKTKRFAAKDLFLDIFAD